MHHLQHSTSSESGHVQLRRQNGDRNGTSGIGRESALAFFGAGQV
jgi:hypothetical protein